VLNSSSTHSYIICVASLSSAKAAACAVYISGIASVIRGVGATRTINDLRDPDGRHLAIAVGREFVDDSELVHAVAKVVLISLILNSSADSAM
jgi:hypothetical protein